MDQYSRSARNTFSGLRLNRKPFEPDQTWRTHLVSEQARYIIVRHDDILFDPVSQTPLLLSHRELGHCEAVLEHAVLLGASESASFFAVSLQHLPASTAFCLQGLGSFERLRRHAPILPADQAALLGLARSAAGWLDTVRYCSVCGHPTTIKPGTLAQACTNPACGKIHFPRVDPAIIVLVHREHHCLLGRQASWTPRMYSAIAGYVEPGESVEDAVLRETAEETGIPVGDIRYHSSQPWPFSGSIMLGFHARAQASGILLADQELEDARWIARDQIQGLLDSGELLLPTRETIARNLIESWYGDPLANPHENETPT